MDIDEKKLTSSIIGRIRDLRRRTAEGLLRSEPISQNQLAELIGESRMVVANIENGRQQITVPVLYQICRALGAELHDVLPAISEVTNAPSDLASTKSNLVIEWAGESHRFPPVEEELAKKLKKIVKDGERGS